MNSKKALDKLCMACDDELLYEQSGIMFPNELYTIIEKDLERLEKLEKENKELKERYKHRAETSNDLCKAVKQYEKAFEILEKFVSLTKCRNEETNKWDIPIIYSLGLHRKLTQEEYELLKEVLGNG